MSVLFGILYGVVIWVISYFYGTIAGSIYKKITDEPVPSIFNFVLVAIIFIIFLFLSFNMGEHLVLKNNTNQGIINFLFGFIGVFLGAELGIKRANKIGNKK